MAVNIVWLDPTATTVSGDKITNIDFGTIIVGQSATKSFKLGNTGTSTAEQVTISTIGSDEATAWKSFSTDNTSFASSVTLANLEPNTVSDVVYQKSTVPSNATLGTHTTTTQVSYVYS